jgi:hypothetical protein
MRAMARGARAKAIVMKRAIARKRAMASNDNIKRTETETMAT